jgi:hypothetical protein
VVTDESGRELSNSTSVVKNQKVFVRLKKSALAPSTLLDVQKPAPGTFAFISEQGGKKTFTYTVKSGGTPGGVRTQYRNIYAVPAGTDIRITDAEEKTYYEDTYFLPGTMVYVRIP